MNAEILQRKSPRVPMVGSPARERIAQTLRRVYAADGGRSGDINNSAASRPAQIRRCRRTWRALRQLRSRRSLRARHIGMSRDVLVMRHPVKEQPDRPAKKQDASGDLQWIPSNLHL